MMKITNARSARKPRTSAAAVSRRGFMIGAGGFTLALGIEGPVALAARVGTARAGKALSPWVSITPDGTITILSAATEMGQGSTTALPLIIAEELDADWSKVRIVPAPPEDKTYGNPGFGGTMYTAGSNAVRSYYGNHRIFGAQVRKVLLDNAAKKLGVPVEELTTGPSVVIHEKSKRRLTYGQIAAFAEVPDKAPEIKPEQLKKPADFRLIGKDVMRVELPEKVNGSAKYSIDLFIPNMLYGVVLREPIEGAGVDKIDDSKVSRMPGVVKVVKLPYGVGVLATTAWDGFAARRALDGAVTWGKKGVAQGFDTAKGFEQFSREARDPATKASEWNKVGDLPAAMSAAASTLEGEYWSDLAYHAQMEPLNAIAAVAADGQSCEIWCGTQSQSIAQEATAKELGIAREKVKLNYTLMGGGFGRRGHRDTEFIIDAVLLSKDVKRPVKMMWTREDDVKNGRFRPMSVNYIKAGFDQSGKMTAWHHRVAGDRVTPYMDPVRFAAAKKDFILMLGTDLAGYDVPHQLVEQIYKDTGVRTSPLRGVGFVANRFAAECFLDEVIAKAGKDPVAYRLDLLKNTPRGRKVVETVAKQCNWGTKRAEGRGMGFAYIDYAGSILAGAVEISLNRQSGAIKVHNVWSAIDCGVAVQPDNIVAQSESSIVYGLGLALMETINIKNGAVVESNFYDYSVPRQGDIPQMFVEVIPTPNPPSGVGQMATPLVIPAVANAFAQLTGKRLRHSPFTPERVKKALA